MNTLQSNSLVAQLVKNLPTMQETWVRSLGSIPGWERSPGEGNGNPLQHSWASLVAQLVKNPFVIGEFLANNDHARFGIE